MRRGTCVKCGAASVRAAANGIHFGGATKAGLAPHTEPGFRGAFRLHQTDLWTYACTTCGYVELHLVDPSALAFVTQQWLAVPVVPAPAPEP
jgi:hypothetical protein